MTIKFGPQAVHLNRIRKVVRVGQNLAKVCFHTGDAILVRCSVEYPDGMTFSFQGTVEELRRIVKARQIH